MNLMLKDTTLIDDPILAKEVLMVMDVLSIHFLECFVMQVIQHIIIVFISPCFKSSVLQQMINLVIL